MKGQALTAAEVAAITEHVPSTKFEARIHSLPQWAQDHIARVERERDAALNRHAEFLGEQPESPFYARHPNPARGVSFQRPLNATMVGCRFGAFRVELHSDAERVPPGVTIYFDHDRGCGRLAIMTEANNYIRIVEAGQSATAS